MKGKRGMGLWGWRVMRSCECDEVECVYVYISYVSRLSPMLVAP